MVKISRSRMDLQSGRVDGALLKDYGETIAANGVNAGSAYTADISTGNVFYLILNSASCTFTFSNPTASGTACSFTLILRQDPTGGRTVSWPGSVKWPGGITPTLSTTANHMNVFSFLTYDGGTTYFGSTPNADYAFPDPSGGLLVSLGGFGTSGQLGDNTAVTRSSPVQVGTLTTWSSVSAGSSRTAAIKTDGTLWAWGVGSSGQNAQNDNVTRSSPVQVGTLTNWSFVSAAGRAHSAAIKTDGTLWTWGYGVNGQLGDNTAVTKSSPVQVGTLTNWAAISLGYKHSSAIKTDGTLWAWGLGTSGQNAQNDAVTRSSPVQVGTLTNWSAISLGYTHSSAIKTDGTLWTWGGNSAGQLGQNDGVTRSSPVQVGTLTNWSSISAGNYHIAAIKTDGTLWTWGLGTSGQNAQNDAVTRSSPVQVGTLTTWSSVVASYRETAGLQTDKSLWMWGQGTQGELGYNTALNHSSPTQVGFFRKWAGGLQDSNATHTVRITSS